MANLLKHRFVSAKGDGADPTQIQPSHWNDDHVLAGGSQGYLLQRDGADPNGASWVQPGGGVTVLITTATGVQTSFNPAPGIYNTTIIKCQNAANLEIRSFAPTLQPPYIGQRIRVECYGVRVDFRHLDAGSPAGTRLILQATAGATILFGVYGWAEFVYFDNAWVLTGHEQGAWVSQGYSAVNYFAVGGGSWTVDPADVLTQAFVLQGRTLTIQFSFVNTVVVAAPALAFLMPAGYISILGKLFVIPIVVNDVGAAGLTGGFAQIDGTGGSGAAHIGLYRFAGSWASSSATNIFGNITFEVQ